jgi:putative phosphoribosyl transferase
MKNEDSKIKEDVVHITVGGAHLEGGFAIPENATGIVLFAHGSGSSRFSPRNKYVASYLNDRQLATLLIDLLTAEEGEVDEHTRELRFDIELLAKRLLGVTEWLQKDPRTASLPIGYFGSSTGGAAALMAAAKGQAISAVVSRGGRPDLAAEFLPKVKAATLLIVGGYDKVVIEMNEEAFRLLQCEKKIDIVPRATHLFEEPGALEEVSRLACAWFIEHFRIKKVF